MKKKQPKSEKKNLFKNKKNTKFPCSMSAKSDTYLPGLIYNQVRIFLNRF